MEYYKLRIDYINEKEEVYRDLELKYFTNYTRAKEGHTDQLNPHYHYYVETTKTEVSIRQYIRKNIGGGNGVYSLKKCEEHPLAYLAYLLKEDKSPVWVGIPEVVKLEAKSYDEAVKESMLKKKSSKVLPAWRKIEEYILHKHGGEFPNLFSSKTNRIKVVEEVIQYHQDNELLIRDFAIQSIATTLLLKHSVGLRSRYACGVLERIEKYI